MSIYLYRLILIISLPFIIYQAIKRCQKAKKNKTNNTSIKNCFRSRFGFNQQKLTQNGIWIHAVSVGETRSIFPLLTALKKQYPNKTITVTSGSTQGAVQALNFSPIKIQHQMVPYDYPFAINRFLKQLKPQLVIMIETEIWPNLYHACHQQNIPLVLANARLKEKSFKNYHKYANKLIIQTLNKTKFIAAQFQQDADNFIKLGVKKEHIKVLGNIKSSILLPHDLSKVTTQFKQQHNIEQRFIWVGASTHGSVNGSLAEETLLLKAHQQLLKTHKNSLLILAPRHPERFTEVAETLTNINTAIRSNNDTITANTQVYLADSVGEMMTWFKLANVAFIGGSLVPFGGHNIIEPAALAKPIISGKHFQNLQALFKQFQQQDAISIVNNETDLAQILIQFANDKTMQYIEGQKAYKCFTDQAGALDKLMEQLSVFIKDNPTQ